MAWRELTLGDVAAHISQEEMDQFRQLPDFRTDEDPILALCKEVAAECRMRMRKNFFVKLSPNPYELPPELISPACDIVAFKVIKRFPIDEIVTKARELAYRNAIDILKMIQTDECRPESYRADGDDSEVEDLRNEPFLVVNIRPTILR